MSFSIYEMNLTVRQIDLAVKQNIYTGQLCPKTIKIVLKFTNNSVILNA